MLAALDALLLVHDTALGERISGLAQQRFRADPLTVSVEVVRGAMVARVRALRESRGDMPLGCAVAREEDGLDALEAGADEALVLVDHEPRSIHTLIDRTLLRASIRRKSEQLTASIGHAEKLAALGTLVAGVAHEINNPLTAVMMSASSLKRVTAPMERARDELGRLAALGRAVQPEELREAILAVDESRPPWDIGRAMDDICRGVDAISDVVKDLRIFARVDDEPAAEVVDVGDLLDQVLRIVGHEIQRSALLERDISKDVPPLLVPRTKLVQVLTNVLVNAAHAVREIERPLHRVRVGARADDEAVVIIVSDTGPGIEPTQVDRIFDPFFTTKRQNLGTGLGLSISRSIMRRLGGDMLVESVHGDGASFLLVVPRANTDDLEAARRSSASAPSLDDGGRHAVMVMGAPAPMMRAYGRALAEGHDVVFAEDPNEAIELLTSETRADVLITEIDLTDGAAKPFLAWLRRDEPELARRVIYVSSDPSTDRHGDLARLGIRHLVKPVTRDALRTAIRATAGS